MRLTDVISSLGLTAFPIVGLALFLSVFLGVVFRVTRPSRAAELDSAGALPLAEEALPDRSGVQAAIKKESER